MTKHSVIREKQDTLAKFVFFQLSRFKLREFAHRKSYKNMSNDDRPVKKTHTQKNKQLFH